MGTVALSTEEPTMTCPIAVRSQKQLAQLLNGLQSSAREGKPDSGLDVLDGGGAIHHIEAHKVKGGIRFRLNGAPSGRDAIFACLLGAAS